MPFDASARADLIVPLADLARAAGVEIMKIYESDFAVRSKGAEGPVTDADLAAEAVILAGLAKLTPEIPVVAEELAAAGQLPAGNPAAWRQFWLVDPLDGTKEFVKRNGEFTVNIALIEDGVPVMGVVHTPAKGWTHTGHGMGTAAVRRQGLPPQPIRVRPVPPAGLTVVASRSHRDKETDDFLADLQVETILSAGSSLKFCLVAEGQADLYPRMGPTMEWDTAAGHAVVLAAGGTVTTLEGAALSYGKPEFRNPKFVVRGG
ncbi:3'(2'),5'-bisphosphate nucleotidase CysQ [Zavarzinia sp.]|uniref:3'(2'),5'-bisphosphate nucleotidase CysQ n=1 Tax=Zavarzinia sp. TaxID=2027920 RepID=UPI0035674782